jgi:hypothetical protein
METTAQDIKKNLREKAAQINPEKKEGKVARAIEEQTAKLPWAPAFLFFGIYNKLVKQLGHDSQS